MAKTDEATITIRQVANGWVVAGKTPTDVLHVAVTPEGLAKYISDWAASIDAAPVLRMPTAAKA